MARSMSLGHRPSNRDARPGANSGRPDTHQGWMLSSSPQDATCSIRSPLILLQSGIMVVTTSGMDPLLARGICKVTKKEIAKGIAEDIGLTQLQVKDIVQRTLDAIIQTLVTDGRIELRNFGV